MGWGDGLLMRGCQTVEEGGRLRRLRTPIIPCPSRKKESGGLLAFTPIAISALAEYGYTPFP
ncbi:hypothetical protein GCM10023081_25350 [Arthrobacter ginkgonis]|uniref:Uncharacterized protein n=1 Tax=Arthrobacter ginkgonis TaxID=1630594 RepID=A0ABP7CC62_9MICC